ncbi:hypothetical protein DW967_01855 [Agathobacter rectalis]|uniref:Uncharacterized protein n=1 Tax=Agathobacter rectalis TaxID=39491 RepID=A0A413QAG1_9FIRM|nr:hypothetical protein DW967_01855 [Agathobacter rectalis]
MKRKIKKYKIISHIVWMVIVITLISIIVSMNDKKIYRGARYLESPMVNMLYIRMVATKIYSEIQVDICIML